jgi:hypothetical protein
MAQLPALSLSSLRTHFHTEQSPLDEFTRINKRFDALWRKAERLVETFLNRELAQLRASPKSLRSSPARPQHSSPTVMEGSSGAGPTSREAVAPEPPDIPLREIFVAVQCLKRIQEGRRAVLMGGADVQSLGPSDSATVAAEEISQRIRAMQQPGGEDRDDEDSL